MTNARGFKNNVITRIFSCLLIITFVVSSSGCSGVNTARIIRPGDDFSSLKIVIDDSMVKNKEYGPIFIKKLEETFSKTFQKVSVMSWYGSPRAGEILVTPQKVSCESRNDIYCNSTIKVATNNGESYYDIHDSKSARWDSPEREIGILLMVTLVGIVPLLPYMYLKTASMKRTLLESLAVDLQNKMVTSNENAKYAESVKIENARYAELEKMRNTSPADLIISTKFSEDAGLMPNGRLDAGEDGEFIVTVKNNGNGIAFATKLNLTSDNTKIKFNGKRDIGDIQPGETKEFKIPVTADFDIKDGKASFQFSVKEKRGYDAKKVVMLVETARLEKPGLEIASIEINDSDSGLAKGNGNGIPESGATIELTVFIKNNGEGRAIGVNLKGEKLTPGMEWTMSSTLVGVIQSGETTSAKMAFSIPRNFDSKEAYALLKVTDVRGVSTAEKKMNVAFSKRSTDVRYAYRILSNGSQVSELTNGSEYEMELILENKGKIAAKDVVVSLSPAKEMRMSGDRLKIDEIKAGESSPARRFTISIPRTYSMAKTSVDIGISQADFPKIGDTIQMPVDVRMPKLGYIINLIGRDGGSAIEQGESGILELQVSNDGRLAAADVKVRVESKDEYLKLSGKTEAALGQIPAMSKSEVLKFPFSTSRRIKPGEAYVTANITQDEFAPVNFKYAVNVVEEGAVVVDLTEEKDRKSRVATVNTGAGPTIVLKTLKDGDSTSDDKAQLVFEAADAKRIDILKVTVNGVVMVDEKPAAKIREVSSEIPLREGENSVVITAYNSKNISSRKEFVVVRIADSDIDKPRASGMRNRSAVAVVIGISKYFNKDVPIVSYARNDAKTVREYLVSTLGYNKANITEIYDEAAMGSRLRSYFRSLKTSINKNTDVFIYYSGHGVPENDEQYFAPYDFVSADIKTTGYSVKELYKELEGVNAKSVTVVIDACFSGFSGGEDAKPLLKETLIYSR